MAPEKIRIVPIAVNTTWFDPERVEAIELPVGDLVFGRHRRPVKVCGFKHWPC
jgi:hypothetical protein